MILRSLLTALACAALATPALAQAGHGAHTGAADVPLYDNLGTHHYAISTRVPRAQAYFDQGLRLYYAFNHAEAIRAFERAASLDPACAICHWGTAMAYGPNINAPMDSASAVQAYGHAQRALALAGRAGPRERELIRALAVRYAARPLADRARLDSAYARAMTGLARRYPDDAEIQTLHAESRMDLRPWRYWTPEGQPEAGTEAIVAGLERVIRRNPGHPGACHFYIHAVEAVHPQRAVACAERLAALMPGAGHLVHMPGHIYIRVGRYADAIRANEHATHADAAYIRDRQPGVGTYTVGYAPHNHDFLSFAASMAGRRQQAVDAARAILPLVPEAMLGAPGMEFTQHRLTRLLQVLARFGMWDEILAAPAPAEPLVHARAVWHYARGRALLARGDAAGAEAELARVRAIAASPATAEMKLEFSMARGVHAVAEHVLAGHIDAARGNHAGAVQHLRAAARAEDALVYGEPPEWHVPVRQELGEVLLAASQAAAAEAAFREDLKRFPANGWSLHGLARAQRAQGRPADAARTEEELRAAWQGADHALTR